MGRKCTRSAAARSTKREAGHEPKTAIDRFYANNAQIQTPKKAALLLTSGDAEWDVTAGAIGTYKGICGYLGWSDAGIIAAGGCSVLEEIKRTEFPQKAYLLGKNFGA